MNEAPLPRTGLEIAIVGMAGRFPGAGDLQAFWRNLCAGVESISFFSDDELLAAGVPRARLADPRFVGAGGVLDGADLFDAAFFGYSPREAELMDPQQRVFLECAWEALEDAGYDSLRHPGPIGVYGGVAANTYMFNLLSRPELIEAVGLQQALIANDKDFLCSRVSYKLALEGPSVVIQSACSTSLVAVHLACQALVAGDCDLALAGGVSISFPQTAGYLYSEGGVLSPDGHCRAFDRQARGAVTGKGAGLVVLKRLDSALADGDTIRAVVLGSAVNNDGAAKAGYTAPRVDGEAWAIRSAHLAAEVDPATIAYVEAHGTATELGDPIEVAALTQAFRAGTDRVGFCSLGSVKTNIGHLDAAAGVAGLIKAALALQHRELPPSLHFEEPHPELRLAGSPFYVQARHAPWPAGPAPRRAGVSAFGIGGTNAHLVLEEAPPRPASEAPSRAWQILPLSARTQPALEKAMERLAGGLRGIGEGEGEGEGLADVAHTLQSGRRQMERRAALVCRGLGQAVEILEGGDPRRLRTGATGPGRPSVAFLLPGLADHHAGMGRGLYDGEPAFREAVDRCAEILRPELGLDVRGVLYPEPGEPAPAGGGEPDLRRLLRPQPRDGGAGLQRTALAQPALFVLEYALAQLWMSWGIRPRALLGYSLGEYTAACLAGVLPLAGALRLVAGRARIVEALPAGAMLAVPLGEGELRPRLGAGLSLAAVNGPSLCVAAGPPEAVTELAERLAAEGILSRPLRTSHAFHSRMMEPAARELRSLVGSLALSPPRIPYLSNVTGTWIQPAEATDPDAWVRHLLRPVRFGDGLGELWREPGWLLLEVGPGRSLGSLALQHPAAGPDWAVAASLPHEREPREDQEVLLEGVARLWVAGAPVDWQAFQGGERRRRVPLPTYPFERRRFWIEHRERSGEAAPQGRLDPSRWFHAPSWKLDVRPAAPRRPEGAWLVLSDPGGLGGRLADLLRGAGCDVAEVIPGEAFARLGDGRHCVDPRSGADYAALLAALEPAPRRIVHLWSLSPAGGSPAGRSFEEAQALGCHSLVLLAQALQRRASGEPVEICAVADGLCRVGGGDRLDPDKAFLLGPVRVIPWEYEGISCRALDVLPEELGEGGGGLAARILAELTGGSSEPLAALRGEDRWLPLLEPVPLDGEAGGLAAPLREGGVYLIAGGLGSLGTALARHLTGTVRARVALLDTAPVPEPPPWEEGAEVLALTADVGDAAALSAALERVRERFGRIDGAFHLAMAPGESLIRWAYPERMLERLALPAAGTKALAAALEGDRPDFLVLFSSLAAFTGGVGQAEAAAWGAFLDAFAADRRSRGPGAVVAIHWCDWQAKGRGGEARPLDSALAAEVEERRRLQGLSGDEGIEALRRILAGGLRRVAVSARDLREVAGERPALLLRLGELARPFRREAAAGPAPEDGVERVVAGIWRELLGVPRVEAHDDFFQIGGHSLIGLQVLARLREAFSVELPLRALFEAPTLGELAAVVREGRGRLGEALPLEAAPGRLDAEDALDRIDDLSEGEMDALLAELATADEEMDA
jgi:phthiocerol/phenolphthiocerol synthesis type-I polyketide synthase E